MGCNSTCRREASRFGKKIPCQADLPVTEEEKYRSPATSGRDVSKAGGSSGGAAVIHSIEMSGDQIIITADKELEANIFTLTDPYRIVIDLPESKIEPC